MKKILITYLIVSFGSLLHAQYNGIIRGKVLSITSNEPVPFANLVVEGSTQGASTDIDGNFEIKGVEPGFRNLKVSCLGYKTIIYRDVLVTNAAPAIITITLEEDAKELQEVSIQSTPFNPDYALEMRKRLRNCNSEIKKFLHTISKSGLPS